MGVGNYTEKDVFEVSRAFTGWTSAAKMPRFPYSRFPWRFEYRREDHDPTEKTFLGRTGNLNGEDIIDAIVEQPACHGFIVRRLCSFFVADETQVLAWNIEPPRDPKAVELLSQEFVKSGFEIKPVLRALLNSDFVKSEAVRFKRSKSPAEVVVGTGNIGKDSDGPHPYLEVEGWHTGKEWINSGSLVARINFVADRLSNVELPEVRDIIERLEAQNGNGMSRGAFVDRCLEMIGMLEVEDSARNEMIAYAESGGSISWTTDTDRRRRGAWAICWPSSRLRGSISTASRLMRKWGVPRGEAPSPEV